MQVVKGGVVGQVRVYSTHPDFLGIVDFDHFSHRLGFAKKGTGSRLRNQHRVELLQAILGPLEHGQRQDFGDVLVHVVAFLGDHFFPMAQNMFSLPTGHGQVLEVVAVFAAQF